MSLVLSFNSVSYNFPSGTPGVRDVNLRIRVGERIALMGANGSGKSTLLRVACGLIRPLTGQVDRTRVAYVAQDPHANIVGETVEEDVGFAAMLQKDDGSSAELNVKTALDLVGMGGSQHRTMTSLSGGEIQRVALAAAIVSGAKLWVLDEPTSHLPRSEAREFWGRLLRLSRILGVGLLYATHYPQEARCAHRIYCLAHGRIGLMGSPLSLLRRPDLLAPLGIRIDLAMALWPLLEGDAAGLKPAHYINEGSHGKNRVDDDIKLDEKVARSLCSAFDQ